MFASLMRVCMEITS